LNRLVLVVVASVCIAAVFLVVYVVFNEPAALLGVGVAGVVIFVVILALFLTLVVDLTRRSGEEEVNF
jgi:Na+-transporting methylmalonyl-CoA/oxaloacetate decarboxylase gamma subunit